MEWGQGSADADLDFTGANPEIPLPPAALIFELGREKGL